MNKPVRIMMAAVIVSTLSFSAAASNCSFLSNSAMSFFTKDDWQLSKAALSDALNHSRDGIKVAWHNPRTGSHGIYVPSHTTHTHGSVCRHLKILNTANLVNEKASYTFCKLHNEWKIV
ncbi:hypothetical protein AQUSIP_05620 [Aquicella siphonis]|uniref:Uncharacterized protein n=1 Tax=Aquicella siphonis TaxID=254247 RepID=A0A5E4PEL5_9COXI|nr:RT0821/Lpp0805 family surface protein [Aquicella siphonis]VVC75274.1 hypothetical protein AQUSIP_05620 [Aquicella siphonis]